MSFESHIDELIRKEGGYRLINVPNDRGGMTYAGISRRAHPKWPGWKTIDAGKEPSEEVVHGLYRELYWDKIHLGEIHDTNCAEVILSSAVLSGRKRSAKLAQAVVGAKPDGVIGPKTIEKINNTNPDVFVMAFSLARIARFSRMVQHNKTQRNFFLGWVNRVLEELP